MPRRLACLVAFVLFPALASGQAITAPQPAPPRDASAKTGTARIRGHVFAADSGQPLRKVIIRAFSPELRENRSTTTDMQGSYELKDLPAGRYSLSTSKGGYVGLSYGQTRPFEAGKPLQVLDGQTIEKVDFSLPRGGVITGRIVDEYGEAVSDVAVMAMRYVFMEGRRRLSPTARSSMTNDIGEFRIFGLPPGSYYLSATLRNFMAAETDDRSGYAPTYYPGTGNVAEAQKLTVGLGQTVSDINMPLVTARTSRVSGTAVDADGRPMAGGFVSMLQRTGIAMFGMTGAQIKADGGFVIPSVAPGDYQLQATAGGGLGADGDYASTQLTVVGDDVTGVHLIGVKPSSATGRIIVDPAAAKSLQPSTIRLYISPVNPDNSLFMGSGGGKVNDDLTFELKTRPGTSVIRLGSMLPGWSLKAVRLGGADVTDAGIEFRPNENVEGIEVELTNHPAEVSGLVTNDRDEPVKDYSVVIFARDREKWNASSRYFGMGRPDQDGRFKVEALPPGRYYAVALDYADPGEARDPDFLEKLQDKATTFTLGEGEAKVMDLKVQSGS